MPDLWLVWVHPTAVPGSRAVLALSSTPHVQPLTCAYWRTWCLGPPHCGHFWGMARAGAWPTKNTRKPLLSKNFAGLVRCNPSFPFGPTLRDPGTAQGGGAQPIRPKINSVA